MESQENKMEQSNLRGTVERIAKKYADLVEQRIESAEELMGTDLDDIYKSIQMLAHITATLERLSRMEDEVSDAAESSSRSLD